MDMYFWIDIFLFNFSKKVYQDGTKKVYQDGTKKVYQDRQPPVYFPPSHFGRDVLLKDESSFFQNSLFLHHIC